jgi:hypothetical protein
MNPLSDLAYWSDDMRKRVCSRTALLLIMESSIGFVAAAAWGIFFGFPSPDASAEESARLQFHANLSVSIMVFALLTLATSCMVILLQWFRSSRRGRP